MTLSVEHPFQSPRLEHIRAGGKFWGYLDTEALQMRYVLAAHFLKDCKHVVEIGGYRRNAITHFLTGHHDSVTVFSLDAEFEECERDTLNGAPCMVKHIRDYFQGHYQPVGEFGLVALGLEVQGSLAPFYELVRGAAVSVIEIAIDHQPSLECLNLIIDNAKLRVRCHVNLDFSANEPSLREELRDTNMNTPFWKRSLYVFEPQTAAKPRRFA
jgi:hypothetical protein